LLRPLDHELIGGALERFAGLDVKRVAVVVTVETTAMTIDTPATSIETAARSTDLTCDANRTACIARRTSFAHDRTARDVDRNRFDARAPALQRPPKTLPSIGQPVSWTVVRDGRIHRELLSYCTPFGSLMPWSWISSSVLRLVSDESSATESSVAA
jgi:hypothetical protein